MALIAQPPPPPSWGRWPQHHPDAGGTDYGMVDAPMLPYDSRPTTSAPHQRPMMAPHYMMGSPYNSPSLPSLPSQAYQPQMPMTFGSYHTPPPETAPPFKHQYQERPSLRLTPPKPDVGPTAFRRRRRPVHAEDRRRRRPADGSRSPSVKSETPKSSVKSAATKPSVNPKTVTPIIAVHDKQVEFNSEVDMLMKAIQAKPETNQIVKKVETELEEEHLKQEPPQQVELPEAGVGKALEEVEEGRVKKYHCDFPSCALSFAQKTHLTIHLRSHTGEKPFFCRLCDHAFSQHGNLKTHERRHSGEKPYACDVCGKRFAQRGNVKAHQNTHSPVKAFKCILDGCNKNFTQRGNLKTHQNKFHAQTIKDITMRLASIKDISKACEEDREMWEYFAPLYKNSNKGIKGRGKNRRVGPAAVPSPISPNHMIPSHYPGPQPLPAHSEHHHHGHPDSLHHPAGYAVGRHGLPPPMMMQMPPRDPRGVYDAYDMDHDSGTGSTTSGTIYEDDQQGRGNLAFGDRIY